MTIKDRGDIKWTSLMLTEHREALKKLKQEENYIEKPELDEQQLEEMNYLIQKAVKEKTRVRIIYFKENRIQKIEGVIKEINGSIANLDNDNRISLDRFLEIIMLTLCFVFT
jgi:hypothetical protein